MITKKDVICFRKTKANIKKLFELITHRQASLKQNIKLSNILWFSMQWCTQAWKSMESRCPGPGADGWRSETVCEGRAQGWAATRGDRSRAVGCCRMRWKGEGQGEGHQAKPRGSMPGKYHDWEWCGATISGDLGMVYDCIKPTWWVFDTAKSLWIGDVYLF